MMKDGSLLEEIDFGFCYKLTDNAVKIIAFNTRTRLKSLNISWCQNITDKGVMYLGQFCTSLVKLDVSWCNKLTNIGIQALVNNCQKLRIIDLRYCFLISCDELFPIPKQTKMLLK